MNSKPDFGDSHNFGQKVQLLSEKSLFLKPRPVYWEWLFFDQETPFLKNLESKTSDSFENDILSSIFQLNIIDFESFGYSKA